MTEKILIGADIGGTTVKTGFFKEDGEMIVKYEIPTRTENKGEHILRDAAEAILQREKELGIGAGDVAGIGIGVPGPVTGGIVSKSANLGWEMKNVPSEMSQLLGGIRACAGNDANVAALGEIWKGSAAGCRNAVMVTLGTGVGGGIIIDGKIVEGVFGAGGEIGHITAEEGGRPCGCGRKGCLERYASATGISKTAEEIMGRPLTAKEVFDMAKAGDKDADSVVDDMAKKLGSALANISCILDPEIYVIGGGVSNAGEFLLDRIRYYYRECAFYAVKDARFVTAQLGNDAGMYGAAGMLLEKRL